MDDGPSTELSAAARSVWAKTGRDPDTHEVRSWMPLSQHLDDTAEVAGRLWDEWVPRSVRGVIAAAVDGDEGRARRLLSWLAGVHDVGKASPAFAVQYPDGAHMMAAHGLTTALSPKDPERRALRHELAGHICLTRWLAARHGWRRPDADRLAVVVGGHHGTAPTSQQLQAGARRPDLLGDGPWTQAQDAHLDRQAARLLGDGDLAGGIAPSRPCQVLLTALVIVADWIASNEAYFGHRTGEPVAVRADRAWARLDLPAPWSVEVPGSDADALLSDRFGRDGGARPVQSAAVELAGTTAEPGLLVIEAPMGEGKTEAALLAAEVLAARTGAGGCFVALPTQATTDAMFGRVRAWMDALPGDDVRSVYLAHGKASLNEDFRELLPDGRPTSVAIDAEEGAPRSEATGWAPSQAVSAVVHEWLRGRKKGVLASFVVGTVDQTLFLALKSQHLVLRHLALAGKVVVIDEVHAYDVYMGSYLDRALHWLGAYGVPVVLLSATLPRHRRQEMVEAYRSGRRSDVPMSVPDRDEAYPVLTATDGAGVVHRPTAAAGRRTEVELEVLAGGDDELRRLGDRLGEELADGGCALVVRNTVTRVQAAGLYLAERFGVEHVTVTHARYLSVDRAANDLELLRRFGPPGEGVERPTWHIVVGSQVVEQSLDVDFDLLATDLAPIDLVLQRMGRLHRHARGQDQGERPARLRRARCLLTGVDPTTEPPTPDTGSAAVYEPETLLRSAALLLPLVAEQRPVVLPDDIAPLVQQAYGPEELGPPSWQDALRTTRGTAVARAGRRRLAAETFQLREATGAGAILGWVEAGVGQADDSPQGQAQVRDGEMTLEVLVVVRTSDGLVVPPWVRPRGGELLATNLAIGTAQARLVASCALRLPGALTRDPRRLDVVIAELERDFVGAWQQSALLAGQLVLVLDPDGRRELAGHQLHYTRALGLEVVRA